MLHVRLILDPLDLGSFEEHSPEELIPFLREQFPQWPPTARLYRTAIAQSNDVTPNAECDLALLTDDGLYYVVVYPAAPIVFIIATIAVLVVLTAVMLLMMPKIPTANKNDQSPNNSLGNRVNTARPNARIPDIFGTVRSIPDLLSVPYRIYDASHRQLEIAFMCVGRGSYLIDDIRDGDTLVSDITGASLAVYPPGKSPNNPTDVPDIVIGTTISDPVFNVFRVNDVNGQALLAPNNQNVTSHNNISFEDGGIIHAADGSGIDFTQFFHVDDVIELGGASASPPPTGILVAAKGLSLGGFRFTGFDPTTKFDVGQKVVVSNAVYQGSVTGGDLSAPTETPNYPGYRFQLEDGSFETLA
jgi:hypothetical protein